MTKIDVFSGFLGAGKTTLIKKLIKEAYTGEKLVLIENEFGEIGIDGGFLQEAGVKINELNSGCICCSLVGDFAKALNKVYNEYKPDRILIEPSGVGKLTDVVKAVMGANLPDCKINCLTTVVDANRCKTYMRNFGEFFNDQIERATCVVFSRADTVSTEKLQTAVELVSAKNAEATFITTPFLQLDGKDLLLAMEGDDGVEEMLEELKNEHEHHHEHHREHDEHCTCGCGGHHHEHEHEHHHDHDEHCECGCGGHHDHDHHHHHADEVFSSWGVETVKKFEKSELESALAALSDETTYGVILRAKGIVEGVDGKWIHFDYVPDGIDVREGGAAHTGMLCVIGSKINENALKTLFGV